MEEEVSLYDLFEVLSRRKKLIWEVFLVVVILGVLYAGFARIYLRYYEATATIMVNPVVISGTIQPKDTYENLLNATIPYPQFTRETYLILITSPLVIEKLINCLDLSEEMTIEDMKKKLKAEYEGNTNILKLTVKDKDPEQAAQIANCWVNVFIEVINGSIQDQFKKTIELVSTRMEEDRKDLERISKEIESVKEKNMSPDEIQTEINEMIKIYIDYRKTLVELDFGIQIQENQIQKTKEYLEKENQFIELSKSILEEPIFMGYLLSTDKPFEPLSFSIKSQELNQNYFELSKKLTNLEITLAGDLKRKETLLNSEIIEALHDEILKKQALFVKLEDELGTLEKQRDVYLNNYNASFKKLDELITARSVWVAETNVIPLSAAIPPTEATAISSSKIILAVAAVAGLFLAIFIAFFAEFLDKMKQYKKA
ncbi:MAG: hypothetical protein GYA51_09670 [Candidatus Methanofastidiosa archaeon]|nr:hypothetical protein [Candidatus Methanofastidiosa archaeon]